MGLHQLRISVGLHLFIPILSLYPFLRWTAVTRYLARRYLLDRPGESGNNEALAVNFSWMCVDRLGVLLGEVALCLVQFSSKRIVLIVHISALIPALSSTSIKLTTVVYIVRYTVTRPFHGLLWRKYTEPRSRTLRYA